MSEHFIPKHGGYETLQSYRRSLMAYQATRAFCKSYFQKYDRTIDQMVQAARSGKQNIIEGRTAAKRHPLELSASIFPMSGNATGASRLHFPMFGIFEIYALFCGQHLSKIRNPAAGGINFCG